ncbi:RING finger protein [Coniella lustricola]|uniref:RING finger protein n=1 Tax=Coniella lustricola TaxID=2025994 RepID=A0A2T3A7J7_9PEZI|nr:RING finger protein [Coniella lustricola]
MHSYSYHLKIELYPSTLSTDSTSADNDIGSEPSHIWLPNPESSIFDILPSHPRRHDALTSPSSSGRHKQKDIEYFAEEYLPAEDRRLLHRGAARVIDCGPWAPAPIDEDDGDDGGNSTSVLAITHKSRERTKSFPPPGFRVGIGPRTAARDWRFGPVRIESFDIQDTTMAENQQDHRQQQQHASPAASLGPNLGGPGTETKAEFLPLDCKNTEAGWGIVHLYREAPDLESTPSKSENLNGQDGTILCIPAVPGYLSPVGFLNFIGQKWLRLVAHYRMLMTSTLGTYMVLMKFRDHKVAEAWRQEFDGKAFGPMREGAVCHVTYIKSITIETPSQSTAGSSRTGSVGHITSLKPFPPPTPDLVELPTCTVCLERMDDTSGLITIPCQHVFHCTCLQSWSGSGCPVCRATNPVPNSTDPNNPYSHPFGHGVSNICRRCDTADDLWICLICGNVGCGRYKGGHAKDHWKETAHCFSLEMETQHVWDYAGDMWVHRLIRQKGEGKVVEFPSTNMAARNGDGNSQQQQPSSDMDVVPRAKLDNIGLEYTHLLTSQLESQRLYFEEIFSKAADKAATAAAAAEAASTQAAEAMDRLRVLEVEHETLKKEVVPQLERDLDRERRRADKSTELARKLGQSLQEEKQINKGLMEKVAHVNKEVERLRAQGDALKAEVAEQKDINHDLTMFISGHEKLKEMEEHGQVTQEELEGGETSVPEKKAGRGKGKGKGKK